MYLIFLGTWPYLAMCPHIGKSIPNPIHWATDFEKNEPFPGGLISSKTKNKKKKANPLVQHLISWSFTGLHQYQILYTGY